MTDDLATRVYAAYYALKDELTAVLDLLDETRRERDEARAALAPFARFGELLGPPDPEGFDMLLYQPAGAPEIKIVGNDCRRAAAVLKDRAP
jgi:hypothetical protein